MLDEPTATLPEDEVAHLLETVRQVSASGVAVLYVTHRLDEVYQIADSISVLRDGVKVADKAVADLDRPVARSRARRPRPGGRPRSAAERRHSAAGHQRQTRPNGNGSARLRVSGLVAGPLRQVSLSVRAGEILGIAGITGSGREAVLPAAFGSIPRFAGEITVAGAPLPPLRPDLSIRAGVAYLPPDRKLLGGILDAPALENLTLSDLRPFRRRMVVQRKAEAEEGRAWFRRLSVRPADALTMPLGSFSGGNQQKILLGKWLRCATWRPAPRRADAGRRHRGQGGALSGDYARRRRRSGSRRRLVRHRRPDLALRSGARPARWPPRRRADRR